MVPSQARDSLPVAQARYPNYPALRHRHVSHAAPSDVHIDSFVYMWRLAVWIIMYKPVLGPGFVLITGEYLTYSSPTAAIHISLQNPRPCLHHNQPLPSRVDPFMQESDVRAMRGPI